MGIIYNYVIHLKYLLFCKFIKFIYYIIRRI